MQEPSPGESYRPPFSGGYLAISFCLAFFLPVIGVLMGIRILWRGEGYGYWALAIFAVAALSFLTSIGPLILLVGISQVVLLFYG